MQAAQDFREECEAINALLSRLKDADFSKETLFKAWTISDIIGHLHLWNIAADLTLTDPDKFMEFIASAMSSLQKGGGHQALQNDYFDGKSGRVLFEDWREYYPAMADRFAEADPAARVKWVGPDMSVASCIIARQMEHWAHAQAIYDVLGQTREDSERLKNVAHIGVTTYSWSFKVRSKTPPLPKPYVRLNAPDGGIWEWNEPQEDNRLEGSATEFCQVVTQCRNIGDTQILMTGETARDWMSIAQCFAGAAETPPPKGTRYKVKTAS
jgi:uncharacterized protein (TIGR03084 family)